MEGGLIKEEAIVMEFKDAIVNLFLMLINNRLLMLSRESLMKHTCFTAASDA